MREPSEGLGVERTVGGFDVTCLYAAGRRQVRSQRFDNV